MLIHDREAVLDLVENKLSQLHVLVVGDVMLDSYIHGSVERISPEAPVPVLRISEVEERVGGAANVAMNVARLGCKTHIASIWGEDAAKSSLQKMLVDAGVDVSSMLTGSRPTITKTRVVSNTHQMIRLDREYPGDFTEAELLVLQSHLLACLTSTDVVILSDYGKGLLTHKFCQAIIQGARSLAIPVFVDPKARDVSRYAGATTISPNLHELFLATGMTGNDVEGAFTAARLLRKEHGFDFITVTMSERGIRVIGPTEEFYSPARAIDVFDVSGAGDTVISCLAVAYAGGLHLQAAIDLANLAAGIVVGKVGTTPVSKADIIAALTNNEHLGTAEKILDLHGLQQRVQDWRASGQSIVFTNGCFDLLHVGHVVLLERCQQLGAKLIVGLNSDASIRKLKGPGRPIVDQSSRTQVIAALASVDVVTIFDEDTPLALIRAIKPDVLVKGGDYTVETVVGHAEVLAAGGRVEIIPTLKGFSTTNLVSRLSASIYGKSHESDI